MLRLIAAQSLEPTDRPGTGVAGETAIEVRSGHAAGDSQTRGTAPPDMLFRAHVAQARSSRATAAVLRRQSNQQLTRQTKRAKNFLAGLPTPTRIC